MLAVPTLVSGDERDVFGSRRHTEDLVAVNSALHLGQVSKGAGDSGREVWNVTHLHQELLETLRGQINNQHPSTTEKQKGQKTEKQVAQYPVKADIKVLITM